MKRLPWKLDRRFGLPALAAALAAAFLWLVFTRGPLAPVPVTVAALASGPLEPTVFGVGEVAARRAYAIGPSFAGRLLKVHVDHGDRVAAGQVLAEMDPVDLDARLESARQGRAAAAYRQKEAESRAALAKANLKRFETLRSKGFVSQEAVEVRRHEWAAASEGLEAARRDVARLEADGAGVARLRDQYRLIAPTDGLVTARLQEPGTAVAAGQTVLRMMDPGSLWVQVRIDQNRAGGVAVGQAAAIALRSAPEAVLPGRVVRVELDSDAVTEERIVDVAFDAPPEGLSLGEIAEVTVHFRDIPRAASLPAAAVKRLGGRTGVWVMRDDKALFRPARVGIADAAGRVQILGGVAPGEQVIVHSERELSDGMKVEVRS